MIFLKIAVYFEDYYLNDFFLVSESAKVIVFYSSDSAIRNHAFNGNECFEDELLRNSKLYSFKVIMDAYLCSLFRYVLQTSAAYRVCFTDNLVKKYVPLKCGGSENFNIMLQVNVSCPVREMLDYKSNEMYGELYWERKELDNAMSWLSTLGGAFSALGDSTEKFANMAGRISLRQLNIALRLGDPFLVARCKLYIALSLIQRRRFREAREIIKLQYVVATRGTIKDNKLKSMCLGIWAKYKYDKMLLKKSNNNVAKKVHKVS